MLRTYLKFRIRRAIDRGTKLPDWLQRRLANDLDLRGYAQTYAAMVRSLSANADAWMSEEIESQAAPGDPCELIRSLDRARFLQNPAYPGLDNGKLPVRKPAAHDAWRFPNWSWAMATVLLLVCGWLALQPFSQDTRRRQDTAYQAQLTIAATKAVWYGSSHVARRSWELCEQTVDSLSQACLDRVASSAIAPVEDSGRWVGRAIGQLQQGAEQEKNKIAASLKRLGAKLELPSRPKQ